MDKIKAFFDRMSPVNDDYWHIFYSKLIKREFSKKSLILKQGQVENYLSFIEDGILRQFIIKQGNELTFKFSFEGGFYSAYDSFLTRKPANYSIQALTDTVMYSISYRDLQDVYKNTLNGNVFGRFAAEGLFLDKFKRELSLLTQTAEERYLNLFTEQKQLIKQIPLKYIASYIGITPQALSRIRKRIS